ncbi:hypothetical protein Tco_1139352 [Tanacetum coccineum]
MNSVNIIGLKRDGLDVGFMKYHLGSKVVACVDRMIRVEGCTVDFSGTFSTDDDSSSNEEIGTHGVKQHSTPPIPPSFACLIKDESSKRKVNFCTVDTGNSNDVVVLIPMSLLLEVNARFANTLYGYCIGKKGVFLVVENYVLNSLKKYGVKELWGIKRVFFFIQFASAIGLEEVKLHGVAVYAFTSDGLSDIATRLGTPNMFYSCIITTCTQYWGHMDYARVLVDIRADRALKDTIVISIPKLDGNGFTLHTVSTPISNAFDALANLDDDGLVDALNSTDPIPVTKVKPTEDKRKTKEDLVEDTRKNVEPNTGKSYLNDQEDCGEDMEPIDDLSSSGNG